VGLFVVRYHRGEDGRLAELHDDGSIRLSRHAARFQRQGPSCEFTLYYRCHSLVFFLVCC
jgi:hypothetical protein